MEEGTFLEWLKQSGDSIKEGEPLFTLESDKAAQEVESTDSGILHIPDNGPRAGTVVKVGAVLGYLLAEGEAPPVEAGEVKPETAPANVRDEVPQNSVAVGVPARFSSEGAATISAPASPRARRAALAGGIDLSAVTPTGSSGRIRERDVLAAQMERDRSGVKWVDVPTSATRRLIAERLERSVSQTVPVTITGRCDATGLVCLRNQLKAVEAVPVPSFNDMIIKITAGALHAHPKITGRWAGSSIQFPEAVHIGFTVETEEDLVVPVLRDVASLRLSDVARRSKELIESARSRRISSSEIRDGCFTVTSLGSFGVDAFTPVIQFPETAILGVGAISREAVSLPDGSIVSREQLTLSLTFDHRAIDGATAARFLQTLRKRLESPTVWLFND